MSKKTGRRFQFGVALLLFSGIFCLVAAELLSRLNETYRAQKQPAVLQQYPDGTYGVAPSCSAHVDIHGEEVDLHSNSLGMEWREVPQEKPPGVYRIAFLGDSFTFGCWADCVEHSMVGICDAHWQSDKVQILNFGVTGYGYNDMLLQLRRKVKRFNPDCVVLLTFTPNDFRDTYLGLQKYNIVNGQAIIDDANLRKLVPAPYRHPEPAPSVYRLLREHSAFYRLVADTKHAMEESHHPLPLKLTSIEPSPYFIQFSFWLRDAYPDIAEEAVKQGLETLGALHDELKEQNVPLIVANIPYRDQVYVESLRGPGYDAERPQIFVEEFCKRRNIPYHDLLPDLRHFVQQQREELYVLHECHFNTRGHEVAGEYLIDWIAKLPASVFGDAFPRDSWVGGSMTHHGELSSPGPHNATLDGWLASH